MSRYRGYGAVALLALIAIASITPDLAVGAPVVRGLRSIGSVPTPMVGSSSYLQSIASDGVGRIFLADTLGNITASDGEGVVKARWTSVGGPTPLYATSHMSLAASGSGQVAVARPDLEQVERYTADGALIDILRGPWLRYPGSVAYDREGALLIRTAGPVVRVAPDGGITFDALVGGGLRVAAGGDGAIWTTTDVGIERVRTGRAVAFYGDGGIRNYRWTSGNFSVPTDVAATASGDAWALDGRLHRLDAHGATTMECLVDQRIGTAMNLAALGDVLYVVTGREIQRFLPVSHSTKNCVSNPLRFTHIALRYDRRGARPVSVSYRLHAPAHARLRIRLELLRDGRVACAPDDPDRAASCTYTAGQDFTRRFRAPRRGTIALSRLPNWSQLRPDVTYALRISAATSAARADTRLRRFTVPLDVRR